MIETLRRVWGKVRRTPRLPNQFVTGYSLTGKPLYTATASVSLGGVIETARPELVMPSQARATWADYDKLMAQHQSYAGWTFCKFGVRGPRAQDQSEVQGIVRAPFGAWWAPFQCVDQTIGHRTPRSLACIEHTRTGMAIGVFGNMDLAVEAAEIAMRMGDWTGFDIDQDRSLQLVMRVRGAWDAAGIIQSSFAGYPTVNGKVPEGQGPVAIFVKSPMADLQRPEKLS